MAGYEHLLSDLSPDGHRARVALARRYDAIERSLFMIAEQNGYQWAEVDDDEYWFNWSGKNLWQYAEFARYDNIDFETVSVQPAALVRFGQVRQQVRGFKLKSFS